MVHAGASAAEFAVSRARLYRYGIEEALAVCSVGFLCVGMLAAFFGGVIVDENVSGTSIFDPVLCEIIYRWWCPKGGLILDPFAGGSVRGIVASRLDRYYLGLDLSERQVEANRDQAERICEGYLRPKWLVEDARNIATRCRDVEADLIFSCPPYADLERYSDDPRDLSTLDYKDFVADYRQIIKDACSLLVPDRFAIFVVGEVRADNGNYHGFVFDTIDAFWRAGLAFYNEIILVTAAGSLALRAGKQFEATRKVGKTHQNVLVFIKGDARKAVEATDENR